MLDGIKGKAMGFADKILDIPDRPKDPSTKKAARIAFALIVMVAAVVIFSFTASRGLDGNPNPLNLMGFMMPIGVGALGLHLLLLNTVPKKHHRTLGKVLSLATFLFVFGGGFCVLKFAMLNSYPGFTTLLTNPYFDIGALMLGAGTLYALGHIPIGGDNTQRITTDSPEYHELMEKRKEEARQNELEAQRAAQQSPP